MAAKSGVPAGIGTNNEVYLLVFFDPSNVLHTQSSPNGLNWSGDQTHGSFNVDQESRPAVAYDFTNDKWLIAFRRSDGDVTVLGVRPNTPPVTLTGVSGSLAIAMTWVGGNFVLATRDASGVYIRTSADGVSWSAPVQATETGTPIISEGAPFLTNVLGTLYMAVNPLHPLRDTNALGSGFVEVFSSTDGATWTYERLLDPTNPFSRGAAVAGPMSAQAVIEPTAGSSSSDAWYNTQEGATLKTRTSLEVSMSFGPNGPVSALDPNNPGAVDDIANVELTFNRFQRCLPEYDEYEDVTLEVKHFDLNGSLIRAMTPFVYEDAYKHQVHHWSAGSPTSDYPVFRTLMQAGEWIEVWIEGDDGPSMGVITLPEIVSSVQEFHTEGVGNDCGYTHFVYATAERP
jgi:hypothetical protein